MTTGMRYFMTVAREQSISRAAQTLFVTQQSLSEQMKRLEEQYGQLFIRRPRFQLTPAGEILLNTLQQISVLEGNLDNQLRDIHENHVGHLRAGMHSLRARLLLTPVIEAYSQLFPNVTLTFYDDDTVGLEEMLRRGDLDLLFGVDAREFPEFEYIFLAKEPIHLVASDNLLIRYLGYSFATDDQHRISVSDLKRLPLIFRHNRSNFQVKINRFFSEMSITPSVPIIISDFEIQLMLAGQNVGACFCPHLALRKVNEINRARKNNFLRTFSVEGLDETSTLSLVTHKYGYHPDYLHALLTLIQKEFLSDFSTNP